MARGVRSGPEKTAVSASRCAPVRVRAAVVLMCMSLALTVVESFIASVAQVAVYPTFATFLVVVMAVIVGVIGVCIYFVWRGRRWARWLYAVIALSGLGLQLVGAADQTAHVDWSSALLWLASGLDLIALYLLFTGEGRRWFALKRAPAE